MTKPPSDFERWAADEKLTFPEIEGTEDPRGLTILYVQCSSESKPISLVPRPSKNISNHAPGWGSVWVRLIAELLIRVITIFWKFKGDDDLLPYLTKETERREIEQLTA